MNKILFISLFYYFFFFSTLCMNAVISRNTVFSAKKDFSCLDLPFLQDNGIQFILDAVDGLALPSPQGKQAVIERYKAVGADIKVLGVPLNGFYNLTVLITE